MSNLTVYNKSAIDNVIDAEITEIINLQSQATDYLSEFLSAKSAGTAKTYKIAILQFLQWGSLSEADFLAMNCHHAFRLVTAYQSHLQASTLAANTIINKLAAVRSFRQWGGNAGISTPISSLNNLPPAEPYKDTRGTSAEKMVEIFNHLNTPQDKVIWGLLFLLGLRRGEVFAINLGDINLNNRTIMIKGKGKRDKSPVDMPAPLVEWVSELLATRSGSADDPLLQNRKNSRSDSKRLSTQGIYNLVRKWGEMVGVGGLRPHKIRHTAITVALDISDGNLRDTAKFSRHSNINTLKHYDDNRQQLQLKVSNSLAQLIK